MPTGKILDQSLGGEDGDETEVLPVGPVSFGVAMAEVFKEYDDVFRSLAER